MLKIKLKRTSLSMAFCSPCRRIFARKCRYKKGEYFFPVNMLGNVEMQSRSEGFQSFRTSTYRLHYYESLTGIKFILMTDASSGSMRDTLRYVYSNIYVDKAVKNPIFHHNQELSGYEKFKTEIEAYFGKHK